MSGPKPSRIHVTEVVLRDGQQSSIATRLRTEDMLPLCPALDAIGFHSLEVWGGATFDACVRFLREDPWARLRALRDALPRTPLQMLLRGQSLLGYRHYPDDVVVRFIDRAADNGIDIFRVLDGLNDLRNLEVTLRAVKATGKQAQAALCYTVSPVHDLSTYVDQASRLVDMGADSIAIKDMAGLLTPYVTAELVSALNEAVDVPIHLHAHATSGLAPLCHLKAVEAGCRHIDTCSAAFAGGTSHPATEAMVAAFRDTPFDTGLDLAALEQLSERLRQVRGKYQAFESELTREDSAVHVHQVPGGMMSNLAHQLKEQNALSRHAEVFAEIPEVRADLGYPPLVTPISQIVGSQAVMNVLTGERYKVITNEVKRYLQGGYGRPPAPVSDDLRRLAIGDEPVMTERPGRSLAPQMPRLAARLGELARSEEDVLIHALFPELGEDFLRQRRSGTLAPQAREAQAPATESEGERGPAEFVIDVHGESYAVQITGVGRHQGGKRQVYLLLDGRPEEVAFETRDSLERPREASRPAAVSPGHVTASMPGNIVDVLVARGEHVAVGQALLVCEAMKMETELQARNAGLVTAIHVDVGDRVLPGEVLVEIDG